LREIEEKGDRNLEDGHVADVVRVFADGRMEGGEVAELIETLRPDLLPVTAVGT